MSMFTARGLAFCNEFTEGGEPIFRITPHGREILEAWRKKRKKDEHRREGEVGGAQGSEGR
jgi:DNA-binding PadR family transcriptional regulator